MRATYINCIFELLNYIFLNSYINKQYSKLNYSAMSDHVIRKTLKDLIGKCSLSETVTAHKKNIFKNINCLRIVIEVLTKFKHRSNPLVYHIIEEYGKLNSTEKLNQALITACDEIEKKFAEQSCGNAVAEQSTSEVNTGKRKPRIISEELLPAAKRIKTTHESSVQDQQNIEYILIECSDDEGGAVSTNNDNNLVEPYHSSPTPSNASTFFDNEENGSDLLTLQNAQEVPLTPPPGPVYEVNYDENLMPYLIFPSNEESMRSQDYVDYMNAIEEKED